MIFTDWDFFVFFAIVFIIYWMIRSNAVQKIWLLICSMVFYAAWDWRFLGLVFLVIANTYAVTSLIAASNDERRRRLILTAGIIVSLGVLGLFKYYNFFADSLSHLAHFSARIQQLVLPIGISFYTFHSLSYMIDTYRRAIVSTKNFGDVALYILFFPQLVAGPIVRATDLLPQMRVQRFFANVDFKYFLVLFLVGYFKKAVISDNLSPFVDAFYASPGKYGAADALIASFYYSVQIYCDFSGYTDMAIASAGLLGFRLKPNFDHPYLSASLTDFWRRWNMSLSFWLRDYLYIPLGGNHGGPLYQARNIFITMLLGGLWHGASWTFVLWGALHGAGLIVSHVWQNLRKTFIFPNQAQQYSLAGNILTFVFVCFAWILFRSPSFNIAGSVIQRFAVYVSPTLMPWPIALGLAFALVAVHVAFYRTSLEALSLKLNNYVFATAYGAAVAMILPLIQVTVKPFIYFQF
jgi:alginate O-acetyltransferase complex protein AlgI